MKKRFSIIALALSIALITSSCCHCRSYQRKTQRPLVGTEWQLIQLLGENIESPDSTAFTITFDQENRLSGKGACNPIMSSYTVSDDRALTIEPAATGRMACPDQEREQKFLTALSQTTHYEMDGPTMMLLSNGELKALFAAKP